MIESVELLVAALGAGAAAGASDAASTAVKDTYEALKSLTGKVLRRSVSDANDQQADILIEAQLAEPEAHRDELATALAAASDETRAELVAAARKILDLTDPEQGTASKYRVELRDNTGVQVGDGNTMTLRFKN